MSSKVLRAAAIVVLAVAGCGESSSVPRQIHKPIATFDDGVPEYFDDWSGPGTFTVARGVYVLGRLFPSAAFAISTKQGVILIDTGAREDGRLVRESLLEVGLKASHIRHILLTHAHYDHVFGANRLRTVSGASVSAGREDCSVLRVPDLPALFSVFPKVQYSGDAIEIDRELDDGDVIELGDTRIEVIGTPGHTPGSTCYLLERDGQTILFSGDVIASLNYGPATYPVHLAPRYRGDAKAYLQTIQRLLQMSPPDLLLTGHPSQQRRRYSIRLDEQRWRELLEPAEIELQQAVDRQANDGADFLDETAKQIESPLWYLGTIDGRGVYCVESREHRIVINAPGGSQFSGFLRDRFRALGLAEREPTMVWLTSSEPSCWSGLLSLSETPRVVAHPSAAELLRSEGIENLVSVSELGGVSGLAVEALELTDSLAYSFPIENKRVLATPDVPRKLALAWRNRQTGSVLDGPLQPQTGELQNALSSGEIDASRYRADTEALSKIEPDIWLPQLPLSGQNANVYDDEWQLVVNNNRRQVRQRSP